ncbi:MAG: fibronectin type III-like domain-contianing protein, partial [Bacteroidota bacterium]|nr:fibronectin type III-like domain-contianing protein [Bacteroidota bacterium]
SNFGADALADILTGDVNPSGKLPITYPQYTNSLAGYIHKPSEGNNNPQGGESNAQYQFGFGLSYTTFESSNLTIDKKTYAPGETAVINVTVKNTGSRDGKEVVQLFTSDLVASLTPDVKRLRGFEKIDLKAGESKKVTFRLPMKDLTFVNPDNKKVLEAGDFKIMVGNEGAIITVNKTMFF